MRNIKVCIKLLLPHIVVFLLLVLGTIVSSANMINIGKQAEALYNESYVVKNAANTINTTFEAMQKSVFRFTLNNSQEIVNELIADIESSEGILQEQIDLIKQNFLGEIDIIKRLEQNLSELVPMRENILYLVEQNSSTEAMEYMENNTIPVMNEAQKELGLLIQSAEINEKKLVHSLRETQRNTSFLLIFLGIVIVLYGMWGITYIRRLQK